MQRAIAPIIESDIFWHVARILLAVVFISSGLFKFVMFDQGVAEMRGVGLHPGEAYNVLVIIWLLLSATLIVLDRHLWLGCFALALFLVLTIPVAHHFWNMEGPQAIISMLFVVEHISLIGGLLAAAVASEFRRSMHRAWVAHRS